VGDDEKKAQKLSMHPPGGRHDAGQEGIAIKKAQTREKKADGE